jgi:hypothetical protein
VTPTPRLILRWLIKLKELPEATVLGVDIAHGEMHLQHFRLIDALSRQENESIILRDLASSPDLTVYRSAFFSGLRFERDFKRLPDFVKVALVWRI